MRLRLRMLFMRLWANRATLLALFAFLISASAAAYLVLDARKKKDVVPPREVVMCFASAEMRAGTVLYRSTAPINCRPYSVLLTDDAAMTLTPTRREDLPEVFIPLVDIPAGAMISAHDFTELLPVQLPLMLVENPMVDAQGRFALYFPIPEDTRPEMTRGYTDLHSLIVEGYCYAIHNGQCLFLVEKFSLRSADDQTMLMVEGDVYNFLNLVSHVSGWSIWRYDYPFYPPVLERTKMQ